MSRDIRFKTRLTANEVTLLSSVTNIKCIFIYTEETHSGDWMIIKYTQDKNWDMLLTLGACDV